MYYYLANKGSMKLDARFETEYISFLTNKIYSFSELLIIFNEKVKHIGLIDLFCDKIYAEENTEISNLAKVIKNMRDTNLMYVFFEK